MYRGVFAHIYIACPGGFSHQPHDTRLFLFLNMVVISPQESTVGGGRGLMTTIFKNKRDECREAGEREFPEKVRVMCRMHVPRAEHHGTTSG